MDSRKRSFDEHISDHEVESNTDSRSPMSKRSRKKHNKAKRGRDAALQPTPSNNKPGLHFASHRINSSVKVSDLRDLVLYCLADGVAPSWISVQNKNQFQKAVVLLVPGLEKGMFDGTIPLVDEPAKNSDVAATGSDTVEETGEEWTTVSGHGKKPDDWLPIALKEEDLPQPLKSLANVFSDLWPVKAPGDDKYSKVHSPLHAMLQRSVQETAEEKRQYKNSGHKGAKPVKTKEGFIQRKTPITEFIANVEELRDNAYVIHTALLADDSEKALEMQRRATLSTFESTEWKDSIVESHLESEAVKSLEYTVDDITDRRVIYAVDCEMCMVGEEEYALTRISVLGWDGTVVMDEFVKPEKPVTNYLTQFSGVSEEMLKDVTTSLNDIQQRLLKLFTADSILVGHSLDSDLRALKMTHPYIVDTSIIYPHPRGPPMKSSLKWLCQKYLSREIQKGHGSQGHNSIEDARACLDLVRLKCEKGKQWGTSDAAQESIFKILSKKLKTGQHSSGTEGRKGAIVDYGSPERNFGQQAAYSIGCKDDDGLVEAVERCVLGDQDGEYIPGGGVELTWARLRELDHLRGWANNNRLDAAYTSRPEPSTVELAAAVEKTVARIVKIREFLPPCTLLIIYTGTGDPRELGRLQDMQRQFKKEYTVKKWDELSVKWTDTEEQALRQSCVVARSSMGLICVT